MYTTKEREGEGSEGVKAGYHVEIVCDTFCVCPVYILHTMQRKKGVTG